MSARPVALSALQERRGAARQAPRSLRIPFVRRCRVVGSAGEQDGLMIDLSSSGAYVSAPSLPEQGETLALHFRVPGNDRLLRVSGLVAWVHLSQTHPVHGLPPGFGLRFAPLQPADASLVQQAILSYCRSNPIYRQYL